MSNIYFQQHIYITEPFSMPSLYLEIYTLIQFLVLSSCPALYLKKDTDSFREGLYFMRAFQTLPLKTSTENEALGS